MYIIFVKNFKKRLWIFCALLLLWISMFTLSGHLIKSNLFFNITINKYLSFSYPHSFKVDVIYINERIKDNTIETNFTFDRPDTQKFTTYNSINGKFSFIYPTSFILSQNDFTGSDILYHIDFHNNSQTTHGFVQVWNMPYSLKEFLDKSKASSQQTYKSFESKQITVNKIPGFYWDYTVLGNDGKYYKGSEVFFQKGDRMYRISYFIPENLWDKTQSNIFWNIVSSFKTY